MLSDTLTAGLEQYQIGPKIRTLRLKKKLGLAQLGEHTGLSPAMLSKIERSQLFPTLPTLLRIAMVFGVGLEHFFVEASERPTIAVVRKKDRLRLPDQAGDAIPSYFFESLDFPVTDRKLQAFYAEFPSRSDASEPHQGRLAVGIAGDDVVLEEGDAMYFDSGTPHNYRGEGTSECSAIVVTAPK
jgi:transcriptional regulator with XRE-family HTH domain